MATEARETAGLIGSDKVEGTYVYDAKGEHIGSIERVMIEKVSGQVAYAVLSFGGSWASAATTIRSPGSSSSMTSAWAGTAPTSPRSSSKVRRSTGHELGLERSCCGAARSTIIMARGGSITDPRERAGSHQEAGPTSPPYTPARNHILGIFAVGEIRGASL